MISMALFAALASPPVQCPTAVAPEGTFSQAVEDFGGRLSLDGDVAMVGCRELVIGGISTSSGAETVYFYSPTPSGWGLQQSIPPPTNKFGFSVDHEGEIAAVGAPGTN